MDPKLAAFLSLIAWSEGTSTHPLTKDDGYDVLVTSVDGLAIFEDYSTHPFSGRDSAIVRNGPPVLRSTAAGRYQILRGIWASYSHQLGFSDFGHACQDAIAQALINERIPLTRISGGDGSVDIEQAIIACNGIWASFPGNSFGQGGHTMMVLYPQYQSLLAALTPQAS